MYMIIFPACMSVNHIHVCVWYRPEEGVRSPIGTDCYELHCGFLEKNLVTLQEQEVFLTTGLSFQSLQVNIKEYLFAFTECLLIWNTVVIRGRAALHLFSTKYHQNIS